MAQRSLDDQVYRFLVDEEDARVCKDIPDSACSNVPKNFFLVLMSQWLTKLADQFANTKTVIPWLVSASGAPSGIVALLVPIRESGSLIPQLFIGGVIRQYPVRKFFFSVGALGQAGAIAFTLYFGLQHSGLIAGYGILAAIIVFSLCRGLSSVASKDVIGKTVPKTRRGKLNGLSASLAGATTLVFALVIALMPANSSGDYVPMIIASVVAWILASLTYALLDEAPGATDGGGNAFKVAISKLSLLKTDKPFRRFVITRSLLMGSGLAAPFITIMAGTDSASDLLIFVVLSGVASLVSGFVWGKLSDHNSASVMALAGGISAAACLAAATVSWLAIDYTAMIAQTLFFILMVAHEGVRVGRKTYLVDMASGNKRTDYVAVSNTLIGLLLLVFGLITAAISQWSDTAVLLTFGVTLSAATALSVKLANQV
ncbi:MAG: MFS transporter [Gammaproteobacteria bacterium]|nr:MFS transporter [Gammaproteobacteria bacterium]